MSGVEAAQATACERCGADPDLLRRTHGCTDRMCPSGGRVTAMDLLGIKPGMTTDRREADPVPALLAKLADLQAKVDAVRDLALRDYQRGLSSASEYDVGGNHTAGRILAALGGAGQDNTSEENA